MNNTFRKAACSAAVLVLAVQMSAASASYRNYDFTELNNIMSMGNGKLCAYGKNGNLYQIFGNPYSAPGMLGMLFSPGQESFEVDSDREDGTAVWEYEIEDKQTGRDVAEMTDFISITGNSLVRRINAKDSLRFDFGACFEARYGQYADKMTFTPVTLEGFTSAWRIDFAPGVPFYSRYISPGGYHYTIATKGHACLGTFDAERKMLKVCVGKGRSTIYVISGEMEGNGGKTCQENEEIVASTSWRKLLRECRKDWKKYSKVHEALNFKGMDEDDREELEESVDDIAALLRTQQGIEGGMLAGVVYHMMYVRDQYGVSRSYLALGHTEEARKVLNFYYEIWEKHGFIKNAQSAGWDGIFHCHENDETEITGYLIVQAFDYLRKTGDKDFVKKILPMLEWAAEAQQRNIIGGMLPFNGDETYIAGGVLPRQVMFHGSAEATLLFIEGSKQLVDFVRENGLWEKEKIDALENDVKTCSDLYRSNFYEDGKFYINNPAREEMMAEYPETRPGVCLYPGALDHYPVTYHWKGSLYFCEDCMKKDMTGIEVPDPQRFSIPSAFLFPLYISSTLLTDQEKSDLLKEVIDLYKATGKISSQDRILGYDYGMFLYALVQTKNPLAEEVYHKMMDLRDDAHAWVEYYYNDGTPSGTPCRPWESGINIEAAIAYAQSLSR